MARHSEEECAYCDGDVLPFSYIVGEDEQWYCSVKCAEAGKQRPRAETTGQYGASVTEAETAHA